MAYKDPLDERARAARRKHYYANKEQYFERNKKKERSLRNFLESTKEFPCTDCNKNYPPYVMEYDHLPQFDKVKDVARIVKNGSWSSLIEEIMKCELVCSNCHRERTYQRKLNMVV